MQPRRIARELALLSLSQLPNKQKKLAMQQLQDILVAAVRTLATEAHEILLSAAAEIKRGSDRLVNSEIEATTLKSSRAMVYEAIDNTQTAINRLSFAIEIPELVQLSNQKEVRNYALEIISKVQDNKSKIDENLNQVMVDWQLSRLPRIDQDILRMAVAEIYYLGTPEKVVINEAIEIAKRYSDEDSHRFINGVLRRLSNKMKQKINLENESESSEAKKI
jgi:N utilization substance protein B